MDTEPSQQLTLPIPVRQKVKAEGNPFPGIHTGCKLHHSGGVQHLTKVTPGTGGTAKNQSQGWQSLGGVSELICLLLNSLNNKAEITTNTPKVPDVCYSLQALYPTGVLGSEQQLRERSSTRWPSPVRGTEVLRKADSMALLGDWSSARPICQHYPWNTPHPSESLQWDPPCESLVTKHAPRAHINSSPTLAKVMKGIAKSKGI